LQDEGLVGWPPARRVGAGLDSGAVSRSDCDAGVGMDCFSAAGGCSGSAQLVSVRAAAARANCMARSASSAHRRRWRAVRSSASFGWLGEMAFRVLVFLSLDRMSIVVSCWAGQAVFVGAVAMPASGGRSRQPWVRAKGPSLCSGYTSQERRAQLRSRMEAGHRALGAAGSVLRLC
jgi:hypothetical protein